MHQKNKLECLSMTNLSTYTYTYKCVIAHQIILRVFQTGWHWPYSLKGRLRALPENIRLGWKGLPRTNALAYYKKCKLELQKVLYYCPLVSNFLKAFTNVL